MCARAALFSSRVLFRFCCFDLYLRFVDCLFLSAGMLRFAVRYSARVCAWVRSTRQKRRSRVSYEHLLIGKYISTHCASLSISAQVAAHIVVAPSAKQRSRVRSSGPVRDGETKILNAPTFQANHMIMRIRCIVCTKSKASTKRVR